MATWYLILPDTRIAVSRDGAPFTPHTMRQALQFSGPAVTTEDDMNFAKGSLRILVDRAKVVVSHYDGQRGVVEWGA